MSSMEPDEGAQDDAPRPDKLEANAVDAPRLDRAPRLDAAGAGSAEDDPDDSPDS